MIFDENKHPRDNDGKFTEKGGESAGIKNQTEKIKAKQFDIIQKTNPMRDEEHVGIRSVDDIKTWKEAMQDDESFYWGDFEREDAEKALKRGIIKIYSSYPIKTAFLYLPRTIRQEIMRAAEKSIPQKCLLATSLG